MARTRAWMVLLVLGAALAVAGAAPARDPPWSAERDAPEAAAGWQAKPLAHAPHAMVVAAHPLAVDAALRMLRAGGSAADAAIAAQLVLGLVEPQSSGLGGGAFALYDDARSRRLVAYDARETAPAAARADRFLDADGRPLRFMAALHSGRATGVPGTVRLLEVLHRRHGRLPWRALFTPAIALAERGFTVSPRLASLLAQEEPFAQPRSRDYFFPGGRPLQAGTLLRNPAYARTLRRLAAEGASAFYHGPMAADIVATLDAATPSRSDLVRADLAGYRVAVRMPVCMDYRARRVCSVPPPAGGISVLELLGLLRPYDVASMGAATFWSVHFMSEASRLAYADRAYVADPAFAPLPFDLLDPRYLVDRAQRIRATGTLGEVLPGTPAAPARVEPLAPAWVEGGAVEAPSTSQLSIVDAQGNALSMTTSIEYAFGARLMTAGGFLLNNELTDFAFLPEHAGRPVANRVQGGKRPRSAMAPVIVLDRAGSPFMLTGSVGGPWIIDYVAESLLAVLDWKLDAAAAAALPHFGNRNGPLELERDTGLAALQEPLSALGHDVRLIDQPSGTHVIVRTPAGWSGGADPRREGVARGY